MEAQDPQLSLNNAVMELVEAGIQVKREAYGFSAILHDANGDAKAQCGFEHDGSISISINTGTPPVQWFFRPTIRAMVELLVDAQSRLTANHSQTWLDAFREASDRNVITSDGRVDNHTQ